MHASVKYRAMDWGTQVAVMVTGIPIHTACSIEAIGPDGISTTAGNWVTDANEGHVWYTAGTALIGNRLSKFVVTVAGQPAITIPA